MHYLLLITVLFAGKLFAAESLQQLIVLDENPTDVGEVELSEYTGSYTRIDREDLVESAEPLAAVIADEAGVQFRQIGGLGSYSTVTVRAATAAQTGIYLDGVLLNHAAGGGVDLSQLELLNLSAVDIYRGSAPVQLGAGGIGGAVNLKSHQADRRDGARRASVLVGSGSFESPRLQFSIQDRQQDWDSILSFSHRASDNNYTFLNDNGTPANPADDRMERKINAEFERNALLLKIGHDRNSTERIDGLLQYTERQQGIPHWRNLEENVASWATQHLQLQLNRRTQADAQSQWNHTETLYLNQNNELYDDSLSQIGVGAQRTSTDIDVTGLRSYWEHLGDAGTLALNVDARLEDVAQTDRLGFGDFDAQRRQFNAAVQYSLFLFDDALLVTPALRYVNLRDDYRGVVRFGQDQWHSEKTTLQLGGKWQSSENWQIFGNLGQHQREPAFIELFGDRGLFVGNDELRTEKGLNADIGLQWSPDPASRLGLTAFASFRDELIVSTYNSRGIGRSENSGKARIQGLELFAGHQWSDWLDSTLNLTVQSAENLSVLAAYRGKQLPGEAQLSLSGRLTYQRDGLGAWYETNVLNDRFYDLVNELPADDQWLHHVGLSYTSRSWTSTFSIQNIGDDNVQDFNGYSRPGRSFHLTLTYN
ncbi:MAG: TonB-dependent receptor plug domain-containing protein [Gammaproteobacteria bacterium]|nr:TonB-dependent receptor plug domain-containing protein [Gammaproteobacteria bacterium]